MALLHSSFKQNFIMTEYISVVLVSYINLSRENNHFAPILLSDILVTIVVACAFFFCSNASIYVDFEYDRYFMLRLFKVHLRRNLNKLSMKYQSYSKSTKIDEFEQYGSWLSIC